MVDFESTATGNCLGFPQAQAVTTQGFTFTPPASNSISSCAGLLSYLGSNGTTSILIDIDTSLDSTLMMEQSGGLPFTLVSFDVSELWVDQANRTEATSIFVEGLLQGGGTVDTTFDLDLVIDGPGGVADFESFVLPATFVDLASVSFEGQGPSNSTRYLIDDIEAVPVPEPSTGLLGGAALVALGARRRQRMA